MRPTRAIVIAALLAAGCGGGSGGDAGPPADAAGPDVPLSECGIPLPGTRCADEHTLERCNGTQIESVPCPGGSICSPDPAGPGPSRVPGPPCAVDAPGAQPGAACVAEGDPCGWIDYCGTCSGSLSIWCDSGTLTVTDCGDGGVCGFVSSSDGYYCTTECALADVTPEGACVGDAIQHCVYEDGAYTVRTDPCPAGMVCDIVDETGWPGCFPNPSCPGIGPVGRCTGNTLTSCVGGSSMSTNCATSGQVCAYGGDTVGYTCAPPGTAGAWAVSGTVTYDDRPPMTGGLGAIRTQPVRGAAVAVVRDSDGEVLAYAVTGDDGSYMLRYDAAGGEMVHVLAATTSSVTARPVRVLRPDGLVHGIGSASFQPAVDSTMDLHATDLSSLSEAFNVFDQLVTGMDTLAARMGVTAPVPMFAEWIKGATDGTYYWDTLLGMFLLGEPADDDGYDDAVVLHEFGHYVEARYGRSDSPGGDHGGAPTDPRLAWSEGFSTYWSSVARDLPIYYDSNAGGGWQYNLDTSVTAANPTGPMTQLVSEDTVSEILWDVGDAPGGDDDAMTGASHDLVLQVVADYLRDGGGGTRGVSGVDLVDWLDGWFVLNGLGSCTPMRDVVSSRGFPYDFNGAGGACP
jgi:hypothetical protein